MPRPRPLPNRRVSCMEAVRILDRSPSAAVVIDLEASGLDPATSSVLSLSMVDGQGSVVLDTYIRPPGRLMDVGWPEAQAVNGISPEDVRDAPPFWKISDALEWYLSHAKVIIGYNHIGFDLPYLAAKGVRIPRDIPVCDVMLDFAPIAGEWNEAHNDWRWQKLTACAAHYGLEFPAHDSLEDVRATLYCLRRVAKEQEESLRHCIGRKGCSCPDSCVCGCVRTPDEPPASDPPMIVIEATIVPFPDSVPDRTPDICTDRDPDILPGLSEEDILAFFDESFDDPCDCCTDYDLRFDPFEDGAPASSCRSCGPDADPDGGLRRCPPTSARDARGSPRATTRPSASTEGRSLRSSCCQDAL